MVRCQHWKNNLWDWLINSYSEHSRSPGCTDLREQTIYIDFCVHIWHFYFARCLTTPIKHGSDDKVYHGDTWHLFIVSHIIFFTTGSLVYQWMMMVYCLELVSTSEGWDNSFVLVEPDSAHLGVEQTPDADMSGNRCAKPNLIYLTRSSTRSWY